MTTETFPPPNLAPESTPWARRVQEVAVASGVAAEAARLSTVSLEQVQVAHGTRIADGFSAATRDIQAVNAELARVYALHEARLNTHQGRLDGHDTRLNEHQAELSRQNGILYDHAVELYDHNSRLNSQNSRILTVEGKVNNLVTATSIDGLNFIAHSGNTWYSVPQSVGSPLGGPLKWPFPLSMVTDEFGPRESPGGIGSTYHYGMDFGPPLGTPVKAMGRGVIIAAGPNGGLGNWVKIRHSPTITTGYGHMLDGSISVSIGQAVSQGQQIGQIGNTGTSTGPHLHMEVEVNGVRVDPRTVVMGTDHV